MFIAAHILRLGTETRFSALLLLRRYVDAVFSQTGEANVTQCPMKWVAAACLFLATKGEEEPRRLRDVINLAHMVLDEGIGDNSTASPPSGLTIFVNMEPPNLNDKYWESKKTIVETEQLVLRWLGFDAFVPHPHRAVTLLLGHMIREEQRDALVAVAFQLLNNALFYGPALHHGSLILACASIELAKRDIEIGDGSGLDHGWWTKYNVQDEELRQTKEDLERAAHIMMESTTPSSMAT